MASLTVCITCPFAMFALFLASLAIVWYLAAAALQARYWSEFDAPRSVLLCAWMGVAFQAGYLVAHVQAVGGFDLGFLHTAALVAWVVVLLILVVAMTKPVAKLGLVMFPLAALMLGLDLALVDPKQTLSVLDWAMTTHILTSVLAFALISLAALQALLLAFQDQQLKSHPPKRFVRSLPSLQAMESLLFQILVAGVLLLSVSLVTGFVFVEDLFVQHLIHKTVLSIFAWLLFIGLLLGRWHYGWRGQTALLWVLSGFVLLLLAYFGSRFVLEWVLRRQL